MFVRLNIHFSDSMRVGSVLENCPTVCLVVYAHVVPDTAMSTAVLLGRDSWSKFPVRKYRDVSETETVVTFVEPDEVSTTSSNQRFTQWVNNAVGMIESKGNGRVVVRVASHSYRPPNAMSWLNVSYQC